MKEKEERTEAGSRKAERPYIEKTVKRAPVNKRKLFKRTFTTVVMAVVFGAIACATFLLLEPVINGLINPEKVTKVSFPEEEVPVDQFLTEESKARQEQDKQQAVLEEAKEEIVREITEEAIQEEQEETGLDEYARTYEMLSEVADSAKPYLVTVVSSTQIESWLQGSYEEEKSYSGMIVADNSQAYLILADLQSQEGSHYTIRFYDGTFTEQKIQRFDPQTGLAVFAVPKDSLPEKTRSGIGIAALGSSAAANIVGKPVIAVGSPQGSSNSIAYGVITANSAKMQVTDATYDVLQTDIAGSENAGGALLNLNGEVMGIIVRKSQDATATTGLSAVGISELKNLIEKLSNDERWGYLGVRGIGVTTQVHDQTGVPYGAFVMDVDPGSPAMQSGIRNGDIIVSIGENVISSFRDVRSVLLNTLPDETVTVKLKRHNGVEYVEITVEVLLSETE
ncbi:MAG: S1C family serine protease [Lachnospiraceae bacterium]|nr:S1C family serine protease [Lachnospiraceae bacterium]